MIATLALIAALSPLGADDALLPWPDYRGPGCDGHATSGDALPLAWSESQNVTWKRPVHGRGWSSPVVGEGRVWLTTATADGRALSVLAFDAEDGAPLHDAVLFTVDEPQPRNDLNSYASPSPTLSPGRVYVSFGYAGTACLDARTGEVVWERRDLVCDHMEGPGSSPFLHGDLLVLHVDGGDVQYVVGLDAADGHTRWRRARTAPLGDLKADLRKAYGTSIAVEVEGRALLVGSAARASFAYDPRDGAEVWRLPHDGFSMSARPVHAHGLVFLNTGFMKPRLLAVRPAGEGVRPADDVVWSTRVGVPTMSSAVVAGDQLYFVSDGGVASCLDARTGRQLWRERVVGPVAASPLVAGERVYFFDRDGLTTVVATGPEHRELARNRLDAGLMASPAVAGPALFLRTETHLYRVEAPAGD